MEIRITKTKKFIQSSRNEVQGVILLCNNFKNKSENNKIKFRKKFVYFLLNVFNFFSLKNYFKNTHWTGT